MDNIDKIFIVLSLKHKGGVGFFLHVLCVCVVIRGGVGGRLSLVQYLLSPPLPPPS